MRRDSIDFHAVPTAHERIHVRLEDWAHWLKNTPGAPQSSPMFKDYRSSDQWEAREPSKCVSVLDCQKIERGVSMLPEKHAKAIRWSYVFKFKPIKARAWIGCTYEELVELVDDGRQMLINRKI
jgi:hypothetical protein